MKDDTSTRYSIKITGKKLINDEEYFIVNFTPGMGGHLENGGIEFF